MEEIEMPVTPIADTAELYVTQDETYGGVEDEFGPSYFVLLRNFPLNGATLQPTHRDTLSGLVAKELQKPIRVAEIYGMTDRSGDQKLNYKIAGDRLEAVLDFLLSTPAPKNRYRNDYNKAIGEDYFAHLHKVDPTNSNFDDGRYDGGYRSVIIAISPAPIGIPTRIFRYQTAQNVISFCRYWPNN
jgi:hypothetical protein